MPQVPKPTPTYRVVITEYERGWGSRVDETLYFDNEAEARAYARDYNLKHNSEPTVPDWYMRADYAGRVG